MKVLMPQLGETVAAGTVAVWRKRVGDRVELDEILADVETDKAAVEIPAGAAGVLSKILVLDGETVDVGTVLAIIDDGTEEELADDEPTFVAEAAPENESPSPEPAPVPAAPAVAPRTSQSDAQHLSPVVRRLLGEHSLDVSALTGTGRDGRITRRDVLAAIEAAAAAAPAPATMPPPSAPATARSICRSISQSSVPATRRCSATRTATSRYSSSRARAGYRSRAASSRSVRRPASA